MSATAGTVRRASQLTISQVGCTLKHEKRLYSILSIDHKPSHVVIGTRTGRGKQNLILAPNTEVTVTL